MSRSSGPVGPPTATRRACGAADRATAGSTLLAARLPAFSVARCDLFSLPTVSGWASGRSCRGDRYTGRCESSKNPPRAPRGTSLEILLRFAGEADDDVGRNRRLVERLLHQPATIHVPLSAPPPPHPRQHALRAALKRNMQVRADLVRITGHHVDQLGVTSVASMLERRTRKSPSISASRATRCDSRNQSRFVRLRLHSTP